MVNPLANVNKWYLVGGAGAAVAVGIEVRKARAKAAVTKANAASTAAATAASASAATTASTTTTGTDPATGLPYSAEDLYSGTATGTAVGSPYASLSGLTLDPATGQYVAAQSNSTPTTNAQWVQQAGNYLVSSGFDSQTTETALGAYIAGTGLTDSQLSIVEAATAAFGTPPVAVPAPTVASSTGQTNTGSFDPNNKTIIRNDANGAEYQVQPGGLWYLTGAQAGQLNAPISSHFNDPGLKIVQWTPNGTATVSVPS